MSDLSLSLPFVSLRLSKMWFKLRIKVGCSHSDKCFEIKLFYGSEATFLSILSM